MEITSQHLSVESGVISCVKVILHAPFKPFFHNLSLINLDIIFLEYGYDVSYMVV